MNGSASVSRGFTLIEVVGVLLLIAVISATVLTQYSDLDAEATAEVELLKSHIRYTQLRALSDNVDWGLQLNGTTYQHFRGTVAMP